MADTATAPVPTFPQSNQSRTKVFSWELTGASTGKPVKVADLPDKTFQAAGAWGSATLVLEGSNMASADPDHADYATSVWGTLDTSAGDAISLTANGDPVLVAQNPLWIRPRTSGGTSTTITAVLVAHE